MYNLRIKWSNLNQTQREQVLSFYHTKLTDTSAPKNERLYPHMVYAMDFKIHPKTGNVIFR
jgi:hypothetical protein